MRGGIHLPGRWAPVLALIQILALAVPARAEAAKPGPVLACPALANYRMLMREAHDDVRAAAALLADPKVDHLGCLMIARERIAGFAEHVTLNGDSYDCLAVYATSLCYWVRAGSVPPVDPAAPARKPAAEKGRR